MSDFIANIGIAVYKAIAGNLLQDTESFLLDLFTEILSWTNQSLNGFWNEPVIEALLQLSMMAGIATLVFSVIFLVGDIAEQISSIDMKIVLFALGKGYVFALSARWIGVIFFEAGTIFIEALHLQFDSSQLEQILNIVTDSKLKGVKQILLLCVLTIATVVFVVMALSRCASMLVHCLSAFLYIPYIVKGDTSKLGEWIALAASIAVNYLFQYLLFYIAIGLFSSGSILWGLICIIGAFTVEKILQHFGYSTGVKNAFRSVGAMGYQAALGIKNFL